MSPLDERKLQLYEEKFGKLSFDEAWSLAGEAEQLLVACGVGDPAYSYFLQQRESMLTYAALLDAHSQRKAQ